MGQEQLGSWAGCLTTTILDEGTEVGEVQRLVWGWTASMAETEGQNGREDLENKIQADASWNPGLTT